MRTYLLERENLDVKSLLEIAGSTCLFSTNQRALLEVMKVWNCRRPIGSEWDFEMRVTVDSGMVREVDALPQFRGLQQFVFAVFHGRETFLFDLFERRLTAVVSRQTALEPDFWNFVIIPIALGVLGPLMGVAPLHSACLGCEGQGMLIAGTSGAGKSTLSVALAQEGLSLISDDWTYARLADVGISAHGLRVPVKLLPEAAQYFPELAGIRPKMSLNGEIAFEVNAADTFGVRVEEQCVPSCVVFLERWSNEESSVETLSREFVRRFFIQSAELLPAKLQHAASKREQIIDEVTSRDCWLFRYGGTPQQGAQALSRFFKEKYDVDRICASAS